MKTYAKAFPRKKFFIEMFTRDISLEDCILDLIDNSIDALIRRDNIDTSTILLNWSSRPYKKSEMAPIAVSFDDERFSIVDKCGGITFATAKNDAFNFGHGADYDAGDTGQRLGAYGIGLKRALFKMGNEFELLSRTTTDGFSVQVDLDKWSKADSREEDWRFELKRVGKVSKKRDAGTEITVRRFSDDIRHAFRESTLPTRLYRQIGQTYSLFLNRFVRLSVNGLVVEPRPIPLGYSDDITCAVESVDLERVKVKIMAGFASKGSKGRWESESAGWYVLCNGRVVVSADKTELTGWGAGILPAFQPKFRGFVGVVMFDSDDPLALPWTTTKRGLNRDALAYQEIRSVMSAVARPITTTLEKFYSPQKDQAAEEKAATEAIQQSHLANLAKVSQSNFAVTGKSQPKRKKVEQLNFSVTPTELKLVRNHLGDPKMAKSALGRHVFEYFLEAEGLK